MLINGLGIGVPYKTFRGAGETLNTSSLYLPLKSTIVPAKGASTPTFTRATAAWDFDNEGKLNLNIPSGAVRFTGARLVRNRIANSDPSSAFWTLNNCTVSQTTDPNNGNTAAMVTITTSAVNSIRPTSASSFTGDSRASFYFKPGTAEWCRLLLYDGGGNQARFWFNAQTQQIGTISTGGTGWTAISATISAENDGWFKMQALATVTGNTYLQINTCDADNSTNYTTVAGKTITIAFLQLEDVSGQSDQTASEYVSVGVLSSPWHGAGVDGCKYFTSNKDGSAIYSSIIKGYLAEPSKVNNCLWGRDLTNVVWTNTNITTTKTATGLDNVINSASRLTAAATDATLLQLLTASTGTRTTSVWVKRISGSGTISLTRNNGTNWTDVTSSLVTGTWVPVEVISDVGANPTVGIKMGTSGDVIDVDCFQDENGAWRTSPILTTTAAVTRNGDVLSYASAFDVTQSSLLASIKSSIPINSGSNINMIRGDSSNALILYNISVDARNYTRSYDGVNITNSIGNDITTEVRKRCTRWGVDLRNCSDGSLSSSQSFDGSMGVVGTMYVGCDHTGGNQISGTIRDVYIWPIPLTNVQMMQVTT